MVMLETRPIGLPAIKRTETNNAQTRAALIALPLSQKTHSIASNGRMLNFERHANGGGWVEKGQQASPHLYVSRNAVIFKDTHIPKDATAVYGAEHGLVFNYSHYE